MLAGLGAVSRRVTSGTAVMRPGLAGASGQAKMGKFARAGCGRTPPKPPAFGLPLAAVPSLAASAPCFSNLRSPDDAPDPVPLGRDIVRFP